MGMEGASKIPDAKEALQRKMAELREKVQSVLKQQQEELENIWTERTNLEAEKEKLDELITQTQKEREELLDLIAEAEAIGMSAEEMQPLLKELNDSFDLLIEKKNKSDERLVELGDKAQTIAGNPTVINRVHEEALVENEDRGRKEGMEQALRNAELQISNNLHDKLTSQDADKYYGHPGFGTQHTLAEDIVRKLISTLETSQTLLDVQNNFPPASGKGDISFDVKMTKIVRDVLTNSWAVEEYFKLKAGKQKEG